jgi:hypothetical protein
MTGAGWTCPICRKNYPRKMSHNCTPAVRLFPSGATRDTEDGKLDFEGFLSPLALEAFAMYMHRHRTQADGSLRSSDNWQKGIPVEVYMKSAWRHFFAVWQGHRGEGIKTEDLCALLFNVQGLLHETLMKGGEE